MNNVNPLENVQMILKKSCELLNLDDSLYDLLKEPERTIEINIPVKMDNGKVRIFKGFRSQHCDVMGPYKGGIRFHPSVNVDEVKALSIWMSLKCSATHLPFGGGKGGIIVDVNELSENELERLSRGYVKELYKYIGDRFDIPAPDVNTNEKVMAWMLDEYIKLTGNNTLATFTGKALGFGGSYGRKEATGVGVAVMTREALNKLGIDIRNSRIAIQGFGNVGSNTAKHLERGVYTIYNENGFNISELISHFEKYNTLYNYKNAKHISIDQFYSLDVDVIIPCALENSITEDEAQKIRAKLIVEGANGPVDYLADRILRQKNVVVIPDILANSGGVIASYFEWVQNISGIDMTEDDVLNKVEYKMLLAYNEIMKIQNKYDVTMRIASYIYSVLRLYKILKLRSRI